MPNFTIDVARDSLKINGSALDMMCMVHPDTFYRVSKELTKAVDIRDTKKDKLARVEAKQSKIIRLRYESEHERVTESKINNDVILTTDYKEAFREYAEAKKEADDWSGMRDAFLQRGRMLQMMCQLTLSGYFSEISIKTPEVNLVSYEGSRKKMADARRRVTTNKQEE
jgi:hypothetical protein